MRKLKHYSDAELINNIKDICTTTKEETKLSGVFNHYTNIDVIETIFKDGKKICGFNSSFIDKDVTLMVKEGVGTVKECILMSTTMCERCYNAFMNRINPEYGYEFNSEEFYKTNTTCKLCESEYESELK